MPRPANDNFLRALLKEPTDHTPIWLMRQAGRYLPEYKASRVAAGNSFMGLATNPHYATEVTLQPLDRYRLDAAILFSAILAVPHAIPAVSALIPRPPSQLAGPVGTSRVWVSVDIPLAEVKSTGRALGATVNDVVLACVTGGFRDLLVHRGEPVEDRHVRNLVPVSMRPPGDGSSQNRISGVLGHLPVGIADALSTKLEREVLTGSSVVRIRIFARDSVLIYSTDDGDRLGTRSAGDLSALKAAADGRTEGFEDFDRVSSDGDTQSLRLLSTYVPLSGGGTKADGVLAVADRAGLREQRLAELREERSSKHEPAPTPLRRPAFYGTAADLDPPRGVMLLGVQGCGKSLAAKAAAGLFGVPLLRPDMAAACRYGASPLRAWEYQ